MLVPDTVGLPIDEAKFVVENHGLQIGEILVTKPPKAEILVGEYRVVRQKYISPNKLQLVIAPSG